MRILLVILLLSCLLCLCGCDRNRWYVSTQSIYIEGSGRSGSFGCYGGLITNISDKPLRIKQVWLFEGETTKWIKVVNPQQSIALPSVSHQHAYHIYSLSGVEIGFVRPVAEAVYFKDKEASLETIQTSI